MNPLKRGKLGALVRLTDQKPLLASASRGFLLWVCVRTSNSRLTNPHGSYTLFDMREDYKTLSEKLGLSDEEIMSLGLYEVATGSAEQLAEAYVRRSKKKEDVAALRGQLRDLVKCAADAKVRIRHVWFEQLSASKKSVKRREYAGAIDAIMDGKSKTFLVWKLDRFDRRGAGNVMGAVDQFETRRARLVTWTEHLDSSQKGARSFIALYAERAREEAEDIALRVENGHRSHRIEGRRNPGLPPYGLDSVPGSGLLFHHATEYAPARKLAEMMLAGKAAIWTAHKMNSDGHRTRSGAPWTHNNVSRLVQSPQFAGMVTVLTRKSDEFGNPLDEWENIGEPAYDSAGNPIMCGEGVISPAEHFKIKAMMRARTNDNATRRGKPIGTYTLSPILRCGRCYGVMTGGDQRYHCAARERFGAGVCVGISSLSKRIDQVVFDAWLSHVNALEPDSDELYEIGRRWMRFSDPESEAAMLRVKDSLRNAEDRLDELSDRYWNPPVEGHRISADEYDRQAVRISATIEELKRSIDQMATTSDVSVLLNNSDELREAWNAADITERRVLLHAVWPTGIVLLPPKHQGDKRPILDRLDFSGVPDNVRSRQANSVRPTAPDADAPAKPSDQR